MLYSKVVYNAFYFQTITANKLSVNLTAISSKYQCLIQFFDKTEHYIQVKKNDEKVTIILFYHSGHTEMSCQHNGPIERYK